jgi:hypothetical protein
MRSQAYVANPARLAEEAWSDPVRGVWDRNPCVCSMSSPPIRSPTSSMSFQIYVGVGGADGGAAMLSTRFDRPSA